MGSHCGGRVPRHKASGVETSLALALSLREGQTALTPQGSAVAPPYRLRCTHKSKKGVADSKYESGDRSQNSKL
ncbi:MAG: hypothetical protein V7K35_29925 [Nostoc sp.]|uniref:hypothetical protein n=1 Tax=Nostoc sp. TaxID=1180 RepID=UPI002FF95D43